MNYVKQKISAVEIKYDGTSNIRINRETKVNEIIG